MAPTLTTLDEIAPELGLTKRSLTVYLEQIARNLWAAFRGLQVSAAAASGCTTALRCRGTSRPCGTAA